MPILFGNKRTAPPCLVPAGAIALMLAAGITPSTWAQGGGGAPPGGTTTTVTYYATYKLDGGSAVQSNQAYTASATDTSAVWVANSGVLTLNNPTITTTGNSSSTDNSSFYGLNAGLLVTAAGSATVNGGTVTTSGLGANGAFATGAGSSLTLSNVTINATGDGAHGVMATQGASLTLTNVNMTTAGASSGAIATDRGGGTINATGGTVTTSGQNSPGIYSTGAISVSGATITSTGSEAAVIEGSNSISLTNTSLSTSRQKWGVMIYQSMSGDASGVEGTFTMTGGSLAYMPSTGPLFYVTNSTGVITLKGVSVTANSGVLVSAAAGAWGTSGSNGGTAILTADAQTLTGDMAADSLSSIAVTLKNASILTGTVAKASITLDSTSTWSVTGNSVLTSLTDPSGISGSSITNIKGNGHTVTYDASLSANSYLGGKTYSLVNGGSLAPANSTAAGGRAPAIAAAGVLNAASGVAGIAPGAWTSIYGTNLSTSATSATTADLVNGYLPTTLGGTGVTINGKPAYLNYVSPTQINVQAPDDSTTGTVTVTITNSGGTGSASAAMQAVMPGLFTSSNYVLAVRPSDDVIVNGTGAASPGYNSAANARPGDVLEIFGTAFGTTIPAVASGLVFSGAYATTATPSVSIGGSPAAVSYCGLIGAGLYQINVKVPESLTAGTYPVVVTQNGVSSPSTAMLKIAP